MTIIMTMLDDLFTRAALAAIGAALAAAPLGAMVVWRRMAFFGDATAHAAILGVALALALDVPIFAGTLLVAMIMAWVVAQLMGHRGTGADMILGVASHSALAMGLVAVSLFDGPRVDLEAYLFGDILIVTRADLAVIWGGAVLIMALFLWRWQKMLLATLSPDMAVASGIDPKRESYIIMLALAIVVAVAIKVVGALLIGALLIIPAAAARRLAGTPEQMVLGAASIGVAASLGGLWASWTWDTPAGPSIVVVAALCFALAQLFQRRI